MNYPQINHDVSLPALVHFADGAWLPSPEAGVHRKMLARIGQEVAVATSIVRYAPGCRFSSHAHAKGEEFIVIEGVFSDERGDYVEGTYVRNPPASNHAPFSTNGCVIFVKLRQMRDDDAQRVVLTPDERVWTPTDQPGVARAVFYSTDHETVELIRMRPHCQPHAIIGVGGVELFVLEGEIGFADASCALLPRWSWSRMPGNAHPALSSQTGALVWIKRGHLANDAR